MTPKRTSGPKRFTVTLCQDEYDELLSIAKGHRPPLSMRYVVEYAIRGFLKRAQDGEEVSEIGDPTVREREDD